MGKFRELNQLKTGIILFVSVLIHSCGQRNIHQEIIGQWNSDVHNITVRTKSEGNWKFTSDSVVTFLKIKSDYTVEGYIGTAIIKNGEIETNWFLPVRMTGVAFTIKCDMIGKIFEDDLLERKEVEFWIGPFEGNIDTELRYTTGSAHFPMAEITLLKAED